MSEQNQEQYDDIRRQIDAQMPSANTVRRSTYMNPRENRENLNPKTAPKDSDTISDVKDKCEKPLPHMNFYCEKISSVNRIMAMMIDGLDMEIISELKNKDKLIKALNNEEFKYLRLKNGEIRGNYGISAIFAMPVTNKIRLFTGIVSPRPIYNIEGELIKVTIQSADLYRYTDGDGYLEYEFTKLPKGVVMKVNGFDAKTNEPIKNDMFEFVFEKEYTLEIDYIPVQIFKNDAFGRPNLYGMRNFLKTQEHILNTLPTEIYNTLTTYAINTAFTGDDFEKFRELMDRPNRPHIIEFSYPDEGFSQAVSNLSSQSKIVEVIAGFDKIDDLVQELAHLPKNAMGGGKNNKHNLEIAQNESQSRNNIQSKKDQQFIYYLNLFTEILLPMLNEYSIIPINEKEIEAFELEWTDSASEEVIKATTGTEENQKPIPTKNGGDK